MTGKARRTSYSDVMNKHPEDSLLLAYLRKQQLEDSVSISQHINVEKCPHCLHKLNELEQISTTLDTLGVMRSYQHYPELSVTDTYVRMQSTAKQHIPTRTAMKGVNPRQRPRKSAVRLVSVPAAFGLAILLTMAMLVFANLSGRSLIPFSVIGGTSPGQNMSTIVVPPHSAPTQEATANVTPNGTPEAKEPQIKVCSTQTNINQLRLVICGSNFDSNHKATLVVYASGKKLFSLRNIPVDKHGKLQIGWQIADCGYVPTTIDGFEVTSSKTIDVKLQITSFGSCPVPTATATAGSSGFSPNFGK